MLCIRKYKSLPLYACVFLAFIAFIPFIHILLAAELTDQPVRRVAIFVENRAGKVLDGKVSVLEDFITSRITEQGFSVLSREVVINALRDLPGKEPKALHPEVPPVTLDQQLSSKSSALRLAQMMETDYIMVASITSFDTEKKTFEGYGVKTVNLVHNLRVSYKILEAAAGGSLVADTVKVSKTNRFTQDSTTEDSDMINEMLDDISIKVAESLRKRRIVPSAPKPDLVEITITCGMQDLTQLPVSIPDVRLTKDNTVVLGEDKLEVQLLDVTVELNGIVIGSAPGTFKVPPGPNKIRLSREGFRDWERIINIAAGQRLKIALQMNDIGYMRWRDNTAFLQKLKNGEKLTDAEAKSIEGVTQMLRQSGYKVDIKSDIKVEDKGGLF